ncbi:MAG: hypothetical protein IID60_07795, partial [Proteobacteria bacterium]|nr:hypothetical protein [Pseudomonadota bacterium]
MPAVDSPCGNSPISPGVDGVEGGLLALGGLLLEESEDEGGEPGGVGGAELGLDGGAELGLDGGAELGLDGGAELGLDGGCGGVCMLTQALRIRQAQASPASVGCEMPLVLLYDFIGSNNLIRDNRFSTREAGPKCRFAQFPHQTVSFGFVVLTLIQANQNDHMA